MRLFQAVELDPARRWDGSTELRQTPGSNPIQGKDLFVWHRCELLDCEIWPRPPAVLVTLPSP
jgi:hypothetical protein